MDNELNREELIAAAEAKVDGLKSTIEEKTEAQKAATAEAKEAAKNHKAAIAYNKSLADDSEDKASAVETEAGWAAEAKRTSDLKDSLKAEIAAAKEDMKAAKAELSALKKTSTPKVEREKQNGIVRPIGDGPSAVVWGIVDEKSAELGRPAALGDVLESLLAAGVVEGTARAAYGHWRKFHGITGRIDSEEAIQKRQAVEEAKRAKEAERAEKAAQKAAEAAAKAAAAPAPAPAPEAEPAE